MVTDILEILPYKKEFLCINTDYCYWPAEKLGPNPTEANKILSMVNRSSGN
jgi:hypothetical protein